MTRLGHDVNIAFRATFDFAPNPPQKFHKSKPFPLVIQAECGEIESIGDPASKSEQALAWQSRNSWDSGDQDLLGG